MYAPVRVRRYDRILAAQALTRGVMKKVLLPFVLAVVLGLPIGWLCAMLLTPILWRLEPVLHMELAGHSGPADWVFYVVWIVTCVCLFLIFRFALFRKKIN